MTWAEITSSKETEKQGQGMKLERLLVRQISTFRRWSSLSEYEAESGAGLTREDLLEHRGESRVYIHSLVFTEEFADHGVIPGTVIRSWEVPAIDLQRTAISRWATCRSGADRLGWRQERRCYFAESWINKIYLLKQAARRLTPRDLPWRFPKTGIEFGQELC